MEQLLYIHCRFKNAALKYITNESANIYKEVQKLIDSDSLERPVKANQINGFLHVLCGYVPVPSKRRTVLEREDKIQRLVDNTWIRYDYLPQKYDREFTMTAKHHYRSHKKINTMIDGKKCNGYYTWEYARRFFISRTSQEFYDMLIDLFDETLKCDVRKMSFVKFVEEFHKHLNKPEVMTFYTEHQKELKGPTGDIIFDKPTTSSNTIYNFKNTALLNNNGTGFAFYYSGDIIIRVDDESIIQQIHEYGRIPTLLDGGYVDIVWTGNEEPYPLDNEEFERFSSKDCYLTY